VLLLEQVTPLLFLPAKFQQLLPEQPTRADVVANVLPNAVDADKVNVVVVAENKGEAIVDLFLCYKPYHTKINIIR
jgi:hypothetical protein